MKYKLFWAFSDTCWRDCSKIPEFNDFTLACESADVYDKTILQTDIVVSYVDKSEVLYRSKYKKES